MTVLIGIAYGGRAIAGVINQPFYNYQVTIDPQLHHSSSSWCSASFIHYLCQLGTGATLGRTMWGMLGLGAFGFKLQNPPDDKRIVTTTRSHSNKLVTDCVDAMEPHEVIRVGGAGNKVRLDNWPQHFSTTISVWCNQRNKRITYKLKSCSEPPPPFASIIFIQA